MRQVEWIVCERSGRWAAAIRSAVSRSSWPSSDIPRIYEVRQLTDLKERLEVRPEVIALVESQRENFADVLFWLAEAVQDHRSARFVALVDRRIWESAGHMARSR